MSLRQMIAAERAELVALLRELSDDQWSEPSLCGGWTVKDVAAHVATDSVPLRDYLSTARTIKSADELNQRFVDSLGQLDNDELIDRIERSTNHGWFSRWLPWVSLPDTLVHHQDIRRPLGLPRKIAANRVTYALKHPDPFAFPRRYIKGLRFVANDVEWAKGSGPEVRGTGEALALARVGRAAVLAELTGDGVPELRRRILGSG